MKIFMFYMLIISAETRASQQDNLKKRIESLLEKSEKIRSELHIPLPEQEGELVGVAGDHLQRHEYSRLSCF